jgi:26S proteasome regulatory subunit N8
MCVDWASIAGEADAAQDGTATQKTFMHVPSAIEAEEAEEIGVEHLLRDIKDLSTGTLSTRVTNQLTSLRGLHTRLTEIADYLGQVTRGELEVNHQIIYNLQDAFNLLPNLEAAERTGSGKTSFTVATNDQLLVMYLSSLIRAVIAIHNLVDNKLSLATAAADEANGGPIDEADKGAGAKTAELELGPKPGEKPSDAKGKPS